MDQRRLVTIVGATGAQGGAVLRALLKANTFKIRCLTRDPTGDKAKALQLTNTDLEIVQCDTRNKAELMRAFDNSWAIFAITNFWATPTQPEIEIEQGKLMADVAAILHVQYYIFSCAINVDRLSQGKLNVPQFSDKAIIREYISEKHPELKCIFVMPSFFLQNWNGSYPLPVKELNDGSIEFALPMSKHGILHNVDIDDLGSIVHRILENLDDYVGQQICVCGEEVDFETFAKIFTRTIGRQAHARAMTEKEFRQWAQHLPDSVQNYLLVMFRWMETNGCYTSDIDWKNGHHLTKLNTFETWLQKSEWKASN